MRHMECPRLLYGNKISPICRALSPSFGLYYWGFEEKKRSKKYFTFDIAWEIGLLFIFFCLFRGKMCQLMWKIEKKLTS